MTKLTETDAVPADPTKWSIESQRSVSAGWTTEYTTLRYFCWRCRTSAAFTAEEQRYTYEVKKANINQQRVLCPPCWKRSNAISIALAECENRWAANKISLRRDKAFLEHWAGLINERDEYLAYRTDSAKKNMLAKLLRGAQPSSGDLEA